jgi:hypothetical protein
MPVDAESGHRLLDLFKEMEAALKRQPRYQQGQDGGRARADWARFARDVGLELSERVAADTRQVLLTRPPMLEIFVDGEPAYDEDTPTPWRAQVADRRRTIGARLIASAKQSLPWWQGRLCKGTL